VNLCTRCGEDFGSVSAFDAHRLGRFIQRGSAEYTGPIASWSPEKGRRCLTVEELFKSGWARDSRGRWRQPDHGAPWALSQDQAITERGGEQRGKPRGRLRSAGGSARLPDSRKVVAGQ
jgi:hypothetical protein